MPTNDIAARIQFWCPTKTAFAQPSRREDGSSPITQFPCIDFDETTSEYQDILVQFESARSYAGGSITLSFWWFTSDTSGSTTFRAAFRRLASGEVVTSSHTFSFRSVTLTAPGTANSITISTITFTAAQIDGCVAGDLALLRIGRDTSGNTLTADVRLLQAIKIVEV